MKTHNDVWFFLNQADLRQLAHEMSANSLANSALLTSETMATPLGYVFDFWNHDDEARAKALLEALLTKREAGVFSNAAVRLEVNLFTIHMVAGEVINGFFQWLNQNGLNVHCVLAGTH